MYIVINGSRNSFIIFYVLDFLYKSITVIVIFLYIC